MLAFEVWRDFLYSLNKKFTLEFREHLVRNEIEEKRNVINKLQQSLSTETDKYAALPLCDRLRSETDSALGDVLALHRQAGESRIQKKLCNLYNGWVPLPNKTDGYVNLSNYDLTEEQKELLNLGINYQFSSKFNTEEKKAELELLYQDICNLERREKISVNPDIKPQLLAESTKTRGHQTRPSLPLHLRKAAKELRDRTDIVVRRADKSQLFVVLDSLEYNRKAQDILDDAQKFKKISKNPVDDLKKKANDLITAANKHTVSQKLLKITGEYKPGYFYGTVKTHKEGNPLRPIISQIPLPTYTLAKKLNEILSPYVPTTYSLRSSAEFVDMLKTSERRGLLASLDVTNLFTNVPVERTIKILTDYAYNDPSLPPPEFPDYIMASLLRLCTTQAPFRSPTGQLYYQTDGIAMGSPLGILFAQAFMASVEETVLNELDTKPALYCRYIDDVLIDIQDSDKLTHLKNKLEETSGLKFTSEKSLSHKLNFLDVTIDASSNKFITSVYRKPTDTGRCLSGASVCPERYKISVIRAYIHRALKHCSSWESFHREVKHIK